MGGGWVVLAHGPLAVHDRAHARFVALANAAFVEATVPTTSPASEPWAEFHPKARQILLCTRRLYLTGWSLQDQAAICGKPNRRPDSI